MPAPTNLSALTAIALGPLPATATQQVDFAGTTYDVWYSFVAPVDCLVTGAFAFGDLTTYKPTIFPYTGPAAAPVQILSIAGENVPIQFPVTAGDTFYLEIAPNAGNPAPANLTLNVQAAPTASVPEGSILVNDDTDGFPLAALSGTTGEVLKFFAPFPAGEQGSVLNDGTTIWEDDSVNDQVKIFSPSLTLMQTVVLPFGSGHPVILSSNKTSQFYAADRGQGLITPAKVATVSTGGVVGGTVYTLASGSLVGMAPSPDETILYYALAGVSPISRWDLVNNVALSDLVPSLATYFNGDLLTLTDGTILALHSHGGSTLVHHYSAAGALLNTYDFGAANPGSSPRIASALDDPNSFWVWLHGNTGFSTFKNVRVSDGVALTTFTALQYEGGTSQQAPTATPAARFGHSFSCPFLILRQSMIPPTATLTVVKVIDPPGDVTTPFLYTTTGGLSPASFSLTGGTRRVFAAIPIGTYGVEETSPAGWVLESAVVSNGDPIAAIVLADGDDITVTFTNKIIKLAVPGLLMTGKMHVYGYAEQPGSTLGLAPGARIDIFNQNAPHHQGLGVKVESSQPLGNPFVADKNGYYSAYVVPEPIDLQSAGDGVDPPERYSDVLVLDPRIQSLQNSLLAIQQSMATLVAGASGQVNQVRNIATGLSLGGSLTVGVR